jgi:hypothetical protein
MCSDTTVSKAGAEKRPAFPLVRAGMIGLGGLEVRLPT